MLVSARRRFLARPGHAVLDVGSSAGRAVFVDGHWYVLLGPHLLGVVPHTRLAFAEGSAGAFFDSEIALLNPTALPIAVRQRNLNDDGSEQARTHTLAPGTPTVLRPNDDPAVAGRSFSMTFEASDGPLVLERQMTWGPGGQAGHASGAATAPRMTWTFAEGAQGFFDTFFLFTNDADRTADVQLTFLVENGAPVTHRVQVRPQARLTLPARDVPALASRAFATIVESSVPIVAERSMYFGRQWQGGHNSGGIPELSSTWWFAEGATGGPFTTYLLFANPRPDPVEALLQMANARGSVFSTRILLPANSRRTVDVAALDPALAQTVFATRVTTAAAAPIAVERAMYWSFDGGPWREGHASAGAPAAAARWAVADGRAGGPQAHQTYLLVANASDLEVAEIAVHFLLPDGTTVTRSYSVPARARLTIHANEAAALPPRFAALVESTNGTPIVVERSTYWDADGVTWAGGTNLMATPLP
jgi:hypothetical protein